MSPKTKPPTQKEIDRAFDVFIRAAATGQQVDPQVFKAAEKQLEERAKREGPSQKDIELALDIIKKSDAKDWPATPHADRITKEFYKAREKQKALAAQLQELGEACYRILLDVLPASHKELFQHYSLLAIAPCAINERSYSFFQSIDRDVRNSLRSLKGGKHV